MEWRKTGANSLHSEPAGFVIVKSLEHGRIIYLAARTGTQCEAIHVERDIAGFDEAKWTEADKARLVDAMKRCKSACEEVANGN